MNLKNKIKIIITDDSKTFIEALQSILAKDDRFSVLDTCENGIDLLENKNISDADLLLIDIEMPEMNGIEAAKRISFLYPKIPAIALTMHEDRVFLQQIVSAGFRGFIFKPDLQLNLFDVIEQVLDHKLVFPDSLKIL